MQLQILEEQNDERYIQYKPVEEYWIFNVMVDKEETDMFEILIADEQDFEKDEIIDNRLVG